MYCAAGDVEKDFRRGRCSARSSSVARQQALAAQRLRCLPSVAGGVGIYDIDGDGAAQWRGWPRVHWTVGWQVKAMALGSKLMPAVMNRWTARWLSGY